MFLAFALSDIVTVPFGFILKALYNLTTNYGVAIILFSIRMVKAGGLKWWAFLLWVPYVALMGTAAFMEYWVQRHGDQALFSYSIMGSCLLLSVVLTAVIRLIAVKREGKLAAANA